MSAGRLAPLLVGVATGVALGWVWRSATIGSDSAPAERLRSAGDDPPPERWGDRMDAAVEAAAQGIRTVGSRWRERAPFDSEAARLRLAAVAGADRVRLQVLGEGIVELSGRAAEGVARESVVTLRALPGVRAVVNRVWTPTSADPRQIDGLPGFG